MGSNLKTLLILAGGKEAIAGLKTAKNMNLNVVVADGDIDAPCRKYADDFIHVNIYDADKTLDAVKNYVQNNNIHGVITIAADNPISVAKVGKYLGLNAVSVETASISCDKVRMKDLFKKNNIPIPWYRQVRSPEDILKILIERPGEYVLKPVDSRGSRGVIRLSNRDKISEAYYYSISYSPAKKLILEEWLDGDQLSSESIVWGGKSFLCGLADRHYDRLPQLYPYVVEDGGETPSKYSPEINNEIDKLITAAAQAIGLINGSIKGDIVLTKKGPYIIEVAARLSGGYFSTDTIPVVYNYSIIKQVINISLGLSPEIPLAPLIPIKYQANRFLFLKPGLIKSIKYNKICDNNILLKEIYIKPGDKINLMNNHTKRAGMVLAVSNTREKAIKKCEQEIKRIIIEQVH